MHQSILPRNVTAQRSICYGNYVCLSVAVYSHILHAKRQNILSNFFHHSLTSSSQNTVAKFRRIIFVAELNTGGVRRNPSFFTRHYCKEVLVMVILSVRPTACRIRIHCSVKIRHELFHYRVAMSLMSSFQISCEIPTMSTQRVLKNWEIFTSWKRYKIRTLSLENTNTSCIRSSNPVVANDVERSFNVISATNTKGQHVWKYCIIQC